MQNLRHVYKSLVQSVSYSLKILNSAKLDLNSKVALDMNNIFEMP